jgi:hypothetical protein
MRYLPMAPVSTASFENVKEASESGRWGLSRKRTSRWDPLTRASRTYCQAKEQSCWCPTSRVVEEVRALVCVGAVQDAMRSMGRGEWGGIALCCCTSCIEIERGERLGPCEAGPKGNTESDRASVAWT